MDEWQIKAIVFEKGALKLSELLARANPADRTMVELRVLHMVKKGALRAERAEKDILLIAGTSEEKAGETPFTNTEVALVATLPMGATYGGGRPAKCVDMMEALNMLITGAKRELRISSPFADPETVALLYPSFRKAAGSGVGIKFLIRSARDHQLLTALKNLRNIYARLGIPNKFSVKYYEVNVAGLLVEAVHAKVVISDRDMAYVGSGELRKYSFTADVEVGVLMRGVVVEHLADIFDAVWEKASGLSFTSS